MQRTHGALLLFHRFPEDVEEEDVGREVRPAGVAATIDCNDKPHNEVIGAADRSSREFSNEALQQTIVAIGSHAIKPRTRGSCTLIHLQQAQHVAAT